MSLLWTNIITYITKKYLHVAQSNSVKIVSSEIFLFYQNSYLAIFLRKKKFRENRTGGTSNWKDQQIELEQMFLAFAQH